MFLQDDVYFTTNKENTIFYTQKIIDLNGPYNRRHFPFEVIPNELINIDD